MSVGLLEDLGLLLQSLQWLILQMEEQGVNKSARNKKMLADSQTTIY